MQQSVHARTTITGHQNKASIHATKQSASTDLLEEAAAGGGRATIFLAIRLRRRWSSAGWDRRRGAVPGDKERREGRPDEPSSAAAEYGDGVREDG
jgi:hypothetical protein